MNYTENSARSWSYKVTYALITLLSLILGQAPKLKCLYITNCIFGVIGCSLTHKYSSLKSQIKYFQKLSSVLLQNGLVPLCERDCNWEEMRAGLIRALELLPFTVVSCPPLQASFNTTDCDFCYTQESLRKLVRMTHF